MKCFLVSIFFIFSIQVKAFDFNQNASKYKKKLNRRGQVSLTEQTFKLLERAQEDLNQGADARAFKLFNSLSKRTKNSPKEHAQILQNLGYAFAQKDRNDEALTKFIEVLDYDVLPQTPTLMSMYILGQIYALKANHKKAVEVLSFWLKIAPKPSGSAYAMLAGSLYELNRKKEALVNIQKAIDLTGKPKESWLSMAVSLYFANNKYAEAAKVLEVLVAQNPKKEAYWRQWAASYLNADDEKNALVAMELGEIQGTVTKDTDIKNSVSLMMTTDLPYKAAMWMQNKMSKKESSSLSNQKLLASAFMSSRENLKALNILRSIHKTQPEIKSSLQLGQILLEEEKWQESLSVLSKTKGLKPNKKQKEEILISEGIAHYNLGDLDKSRQSFVAVADTSETARTWLSFIQKQDVKD